MFVVGHVTKGGGIAGPEDARAHRRHGALLRGRGLSRPPRAARDEESLRRRRRDRRVPHDGGRPRSRRESVRALPRRPPRERVGHARSPRSWRARGRCSSKCRRSPRRRASARRSAWPPATTAAASRCCSRCSTSARGSSFAQLDVFVNVVGGLQGAGAGGRSRGRRGARVERVRPRASARTPILLGEVGLGGEIRPVSQAERRLAEAEKMGMSVAYLAERSVPEARAERASACVGVQTRARAARAHLRVSGDARATSAS